MGERLASKHLCMGILAHVDAGKTTLSESMLYLTGSIRRLGRVDHGDAYLDTEALERERGITIFSKQAVFTQQERQVTLLDTPGHVDFSAEMERTLQVLDYAILVVNGADGVQSHTKTLWRLLQHYEVPTFIFVNKMDQPGTDRKALFAELRVALDDRCIDFTDVVMQDTLEDAELCEELALCSETLLNQVLEQGCVPRDMLKEHVRARKLFPCYFGSALRLWGVEEFLRGFYDLTDCPSYPETFGAQVIKISRDAQGNRLTHLKLTGGELRVKAMCGEEKIDFIRRYSGNRFESVNEAEPGGVYAVIGLEHTYAGQCMGWQAEEKRIPVLEPLMTYRLLFPEDCDVPKMRIKLRQLEEEIPELRLVWNETSQELYAGIMGQVQIEVLKEMIRTRFGIAVELDSGRVMYKETIANTVEGVGHYEPLRHYAEVHLRMEPGEPGSGLVFDTEVNEDDLERHWQRLILTHLEEREHVGVLTGSPIADMKITLVSGRAHQKHTEGGDFRQATYRAVRQGLMSAESVLLEPLYEFRLEVPTGNVGRAMSDLQRRNATFSQPDLEGDMAVLNGKAPVAMMGDYPAEVLAYTGGLGRLFCSYGGYAPCINPDEVIEQWGYVAESDMDNPPSSIFCSHGAGYVVEWDAVPRYMHLPFQSEKQASMATSEEEMPLPGNARRKTKEEGGSGFGGVSFYDDDELQEIFLRTYGAGKQRTGSTGRRVITGQMEQDVVQKERKKAQAPAKEYLLVDGYNMIFAWEELQQLAKTNLDAARGRLLDLLCNYQGFRKNTVIVVFDAYKVPGNPGSVEQYQNIYVVYTKEAETADQYIEKTVHEIGQKHHITVATSDQVEQIIIFGRGAVRLSAREFQEEVMQVEGQIQKHVEARLDAASRLRLGDMVDLPET